MCSHSVYKLSFQSKTQYIYTNLFVVNAIVSKHLRLKDFTWCAYVSLYKCILYMGLVNLSNQQFGDVCLVQQEARKSGP